MVSLSTRTLHPYHQADHALVFLTFKVGYRLFVHSPR